MLVGSRIRRLERVGLTIAVAASGYEACHATCGNHGGPEGCGACRSRPSSARFLGGQSLFATDERVSTLQAGTIHIITNQRTCRLSHRRFRSPDVESYGERSDATQPMRSVLRRRSSRRDPDAVIGVFTADHVISPLDRFCDAVQRYWRGEQHPTRW